MSSSFSSNSQQSSYSWQETAQYFIDINEDDFKEAINTNTIIFNDPLFSAYIYSKRAERLIRKDLFGFKTEYQITTWKDFYNRILFLVNNKDKSWIVNFYTKSGNLMELKLLNVFPNQNDIDDAARAGKYNVLEHYSDYLLPTMSVAEEITRLGSTQILDFLKKYSKLPSFSYFYQAMIKRNLFFIEWYNNNIPIRQINVFENLNSLPKFNELYTEIARNKDLDLWELIQEHFILQFSSLFNLLKIGLKEDNKNIFDFILHQIRLDRYEENISDDTLEKLLDSHFQIHQEIIKVKGNEVKNLTYFYEHGLEAQMTSKLIDFVIENNLYKVMYLMYEKNGKINYIEKNYAKWKKQKKISIEMNNVIQHALTRPIKSGKDVKQDIINEGLNEFRDTMKPFMNDSAMNSSLSMIEQFTNTILKNN